MAAVLLSGCVAQGDFGRIQPSGVNRYLGHDVYAHVPGFESPANALVSLTADESELRARAYSLVFRRAHTQSHDHWSEPNRFAVTRIPTDRLPDARAYARSMAEADYRSPEARVNAIVDDIRADLVGIDAFERAALVVFAGDAARIVDLERVATSDETAAAVSRRTLENRQIVEQTLAALVEKLAGYELALGDTLVTGGQDIRAGAGQELENIKRRVARLEANVRQTEGRYAMNLPREPDCIERSLARIC